MYNIITSENIKDLLEDCNSELPLNCKEEEDVHERIQDMIDLLNMYPFQIGRAD